MLESLGLGSQSKSCKGGAILFQENKALPAPLPEAQLCLTRSFSHIRDHSTTNHEHSVVTSSVEFY